MPLQKRLCLLHGLDGDCFMKGGGAIPLAHVREEKALPGEVICCYVQKPLHTAGKLLGSVYSWNGRHVSPSCMQSAGLGCRWVAADAVQEQADRSAALFEPKLLRWASPALLRTCALSTTLPSAQTSGIQICRGTGSSPFAVRGNKADGRNEVLSLTWTRAPLLQFANLLFSSNKARESLVRSCEAPCASPP